MASGSQKWKGNCAALVKAEKPMSSATVVVSPGDCAQTGDASTALSCVVPAATETTARPASSVSPPKKVRMSVR